jgi:hypothetical protein
VGRWEGKFLKKKREKKEGKKSKLTGKHVQSRMLYVKVACAH